MSHLQVGYLFKVVKTSLDKTLIEFGLVMMIIACFQCVCLGGLFNLAVRLMQLFSTTEDVNYVHLTSLLGLYFQASNSVKAFTRQQAPDNLLTKNGHFY